MLVPLGLYAMFLLFKHPGGWLIINFVVPLKALAEYASIHEKILKYIMTRDEMNDETRKFQALYYELIENLSNKFITLVMMIMFHLAMCICSTHTVGFVLVLLYVSGCVIKLVRYHLFMISPQTPERIEMFENT